MSAPRYPWDLCKLLNSKPNIGWLMDLCEENYRHIIRMAPELRTLKGQYISQLDDAVDLHLDILEVNGWPDRCGLTGREHRSTAGCWHAANTACLGE